MKKTIVIAAGLLISFGLGFFIRSKCCNSCEVSADKKVTITEKDSVVSTTKSLNKINNTMKLGAFSVSLNVKDLTVSKTFYENLGFTVFAGSMESNYLIMKNENSLIGIFQGMFEGNILTFNPGWDENAQNIESFDDVRSIQKIIKSKDIPLSLEVDETTVGPGSIMLTDPDGNVILIDQHR